MISVTQLIKHYETPFNVEYYSSKRALSNILNERLGKSAIYTFANHLKTMSEDKGLEYMNKLVDIKGFSDEFIYAKDAIKREWALNYKNKTKEGIEKHEKEYGVVDKMITVGLNSSCDYKFENGIYNESVVASQKYKLIGRIDKLSVNNGKVSIEDLKTGKLESVNTNYNNFKYPLDNWNQSPIIKARIQVSLYALILEDLGYKIDKLQIKHTNGFGGIITPVQYMKNEVKYLIEHYNENNTG
jgi:ATP-dependent exoDNAse (exonuclease V) beta subunit